MKKVVSTLISVGLIILSLNSYADSHSIKPTVTRLVTHNRDSGHSSRFDYWVEAQGYDEPSTAKVFHVVARNQGEAEEFVRMKYDQLLVYPNNNSKPFEKANFIPTQISNSMNTVAQAVGNEPGPYSGVTTFLVEVGVFNYRDSFQKIKVVARNQRAAEDFAKFEYNRINRGDKTIDLIQFDNAAQASSAPAQVQTQNIMWDHVDLDTLKFPTEVAKPADSSRTIGLTTFLSNSPARLNNFWAYILNRDELKALKSFREDLHRAPGANIKVHDMKRSPKSRSYDLIIQVTIGMKEKYIQIKNVDLNEISSDIYNLPTRLTFLFRYNLPNKITSGLEALRSLFDLSEEHPRLRGYKNIQADIGRVEISPDNIIKIQIDYVYELPNWLPEVRIDKTIELKTKEDVSALIAKKGLSEDFRSFIRYIAYQARIIDKDSLSCVEHLAQ